MNETDLNLLIFLSARTKRGYDDLAIKQINDALTEIKFSGKLDLCDGGLQPIYPGEVTSGFLASYTMCQYLIERGQYLRANSQ